MYRGSTKKKSGQCAKKPWQLGSQNSATRILIDTFKNPGSQGSQTQYPRDPPKKSGWCAKKPWQLGTQGSATWILKDTFKNPGSYGSQTQYPGDSQKNQGSVRKNVGSQVGRTQGHGSYQIPSRILVARVARHYVRGIHQKKIRVLCEKTLVARQLGLSDTDLNRYLQKSWQLGQLDTWILCLATLATRILKVSIKIHVAESQLPSYQGFFAHYPDFFCGSPGYCVQLPQLPRFFKVSNKIHVAESQLPSYQGFFAH